MADKMYMLTTVKTELLYFVATSIEMKAGGYYKHQKWYILAVPSMRKWSGWN